MGYDKDLFIKTIVAQSAEEGDKLVNDFGQEHSIKATQSCPTYDFHQKKIIYVYILFYLPKDNAKRIMPGEKILTDKPKIIIAESEAKWCECLVCKARWKWTHYKMCPNKHSIEGLPKEAHELYKKIWFTQKAYGMMENGNKENNKMD